MMEYYITKPDDTLQRLSAIWYGDWTIWRLIYDLNPQLGDNPFDIPAGRIIKVPEPLYEDQTHVIVNGDEYFSLAIRYYGTGHFDGKIRVANNHLVLHENLGKEIVIPALVSWRTLQFAYKGFEE